MYKIFIIISLFIFFSLNTFASDGDGFLSTANELMGNPKTCLELNFSSDGDTKIEYIYLDNNTQEVYFADSKIQPVILNYSDNNIRFKATYPAPNDKGWTVEAVYEINRYTGGCTVVYTKMATSISEKFNTAFLGINNKYVYTYTGTARKVDTKIQKF